MARLLDKVVIITGAGAGMGREMAILFANEGAKVAITDVDLEGAKETLRLIDQIPNAKSSKVWELDVSVEEDVKNKFSEIVEHFGEIDVLVNNAGVTGVDKPTHEVTEEEWDKVFSVDVKGVFFCTKYAVKSMLKKRKGSIINFSSIYGLVGSPELTPYHAAKGAVTSMTKQDAVVYGKSGIRVNSIHPGTILTPLVEELGSRGEGGLEAYKKKMGEKHPIGHPGEPKDVAYAALYLASDESKFTTGLSMAVDGGYTAQ